MQPTYWQKQTHNKPLYPNMIWDRPENRMHAGKLLIIGGNSGGFAAIAESYGEADKAGIGTTRAILPSSLSRTLRDVFPEAEYVSKTPSGSFARESLGELLSSSLWADGVLLPGDLGRNSETAILIESFAGKYHAGLTLAGDAVDYFFDIPSIMDRADTTLVVTLQQLQKLAALQGIALTSQLPLLTLVERLHELSEHRAASIVLVGETETHIAHLGDIISTPCKRSVATVAAHAAVWRLQNPSRPLEALASSLAEL